ncbi:MAG: cyclase family protein [Euryarchaeota archaeon]|nr:cyclase family protein [Euryarchaeota archaeon]MBU4608916.1 cyclase family protein [Euryarchaeota archaeon]MBV1728684.1 cyclase family protein [Methanobacterium sp.]MBV1754772.1 cyclase family protein [Methanobacterium sp.]
MQIIDLSHVLTNGMPVFPQDPPFILEEIINFENDLYSLSILKTGLHAGTHIDAPYHFHSSGRKINQIKLKDLMGTAKIIDVEKEVKAEDLQSIENIEILVIRTSWSNKWGKKEYFEDNPYLSRKAAEIITESQIKGVGIDGPSVDPPGEITIHKKLLTNGLWVVENLNNLDQIKSTNVEIYFIPLPLEGEASPVRAFAKIVKK